MMDPVVFTALCPRGQRIQDNVDRQIAETRRVVYLLQEAEDDHPAFAPRYRDELTTAKRRLHQERSTLIQHAGHCTDGCTRDTSGGLSPSAFQWGRAPSHGKPTLPPMVDVAARLCAGEAVEAIAAEYDRHVSTLQQRLSAAGFSSTTGRPIARPHTAVHAVLAAVEADEPWRDDALCAQTDPEAFFPDRGGSTRAAKRTCLSCPVRVECLESALDHDERFGVWGGLSERERRALKKNRTPATRQQESA